MQVSRQRWLTVGAIVFLGGAGLLMADAVSAAACLKVPAAVLHMQHYSNSGQHPFCRTWARVSSFYLLQQVFEFHDHYIYSNLCSSFFDGHAAWMTSAVW